MIGWSAIGGAVLVGMVLLGFCAYELTWKAQRLKRDLVVLRRVTDELQQTQKDLTLLGARLRSVAPGNR